MDITDSSAVQAAITPETRVLYCESTSNPLLEVAVSLGYFKLLFRAPGQSTSSEIPVDEQQSMGLSEGLIRISVGLDNDIRSTWEVICMRLADVGVKAGEPVPSIEL